MYLAIFLIVLIFFFLAKSIKKPFMYPPGPICLPFVGNILVLNYLKTLKFYHILWQFLSNTYGEIVGLKFFNDHLIIVSGKRLIKQLNLREELDGRPNGFFFRIRSFDKRLGLVFTDGCLWEKQRVFSVKTFKSVGLGKTLMAEIIELEARELMKKLHKLCVNDQEIIIQGDESNIFDISVVNVMWKLLRGQRFELDDPEALKLMETIHKSFRIIDMSGGFLNHLPLIRFILPIKSGYQPLVDTMRPLWNFLQKSISEVARNLEHNTDTPPNFMKFYIEEMMKPNSSEEYFSEEQLLATCVDFFQAGSETTSNTLSFAILYMLHYPQVKWKVQEELEVVIGNRLPRVSDRPKLKYTESVICEIQRMVNVAPLGIAHRALESVEIDNFIIPKNSTVLFNLYSIHMDESYWKNPYEFMPERFLNKNGDLISHDSFIPFGVGKRRCIGENLAKNSLLHFFATLLQVFDFEQCDNTLPELCGKDGITLSPFPFKARFKKRLHVTHC